MTNKMTISCTPLENDEIRNLPNNCVYINLKESKLYETDDRSTGLAAVALVELAQKLPSDGEVQSKERKQTHMPSTFLTKLMDILNRSEYSRVLSWTADGQSISLNNQREIIEPILRLHFKALKYDVFIRKLRRWGFTKIGTGKHYDFFYNKFFQRGELIRCNKVKNLDEMALPESIPYANSVELNLESMLDKESVSSYFHNNNITVTADDNKLLQPNRPILDLSHMQQDDSQLFYEFPTIPFNYLSRRLNNSSVHKKIIGEALQYLLTENMRQNDGNIELQSDLPNVHAIRTSEFTNIEPTSKYSTLELLSVFEGCR